jgi:hypothetical protein
MRARWIPAVLAWLGLVVSAANGQTPGAPTQQPSSPPSPLSNATGAGQSWTQRFDELWHQREDPKTLEQLRNLAQAELGKDPKSYDANWRMASILVWQADGLPDGDEKAALGKQGWEIGDKAAQADPKRVEGQYYAGAGLGLYSEGVGIVKALSQGLEGKFRNYSLAALRTDRDFLDGAPLVLWGRYFFKLPWPKRDVGQSIKVLTNMLNKHPTNLRGKLYLADALLSDGNKPEAKKQIDEIVAAPVGVDPSEDHRIKSRAGQWMKEHQKDMM